MTDGLSIMWGSVDLDTGQWLPNHDLIMSVDQQFNKNVKNGLICGHCGRIPIRCGTPPWNIIDFSNSVT